MLSWFLNRLAGYPSSRHGVNIPYLQSGRGRKDDKVDMLAKLPRTTLLHIYEQMKLGLSLYISHTVLYSGKIWKSKDWLTTFPFGTCEEKWC